MRLPWAEGKGMEYPVVENGKVFQNHFKLALDISGADSLPIPGQFYNLRCTETKDPLLRRPFSVHRVRRDDGFTHLEILYRIIGKGTEWLSRRKKGEVLDVIGPLGNGFLIEENATHAVLVARGIGIAPLYAVGEAFRVSHPAKPISILMGARLKERIFYEEECQAIGEVFLYTDDGSRGFHGRAPDLLAHLIEHKKLPERIYLYACGPGQMLKELADLSERFRFPGQVALEDHMGCGFGACLSCVCPLKPHHIRRDHHWQKPALQWSENESQVYSLICKDGPVYDIREVDWDEWLA